ncbi:MAG: single-stranded DNA-binding protein [Chlorobiaceae bacterium]|jgi:single-strand DNA-binding protein|nr:single-stranded DNA-binding protein [Chlorobiaceae bacterium]NTV17737.1 single-stranded DNA-binding protein [Chlorobiaceae bacterium]
MAELKMPEINSVVIAGNLTKDPVFRQTNSGGTPVVNFSIACNRRFRDSNHQWQEDVCYVGVVAWNKLAESCRDNLKKSSAVLVDGELQSRTWKAQDGTSRTVVEIKARRIQFLNKRKKDGEEDDEGFIEDDCHDHHHGEIHEEDPGHIYEYKYLSSD